MDQTIPGALFAWDFISPDFMLSHADGTSPVGAAELLARIGRAASAFDASGVRYGDSVLFCGEQGVGAFVAFWATVSLGASLVPVDPSWPDYLRRHALRKIRPRLLVAADDSELARWRSLDGQLPVLRIGMGLAQTADTRPRSDQALNIAPDAPAACLFTSGTTADPKVVVLSRAALAHSAALAASSFEWIRGERLLNLPEPHTMSGLRNACLAAPLAGMQWVCAPRSRRPDIFSLLDLLDRAQAHRIVAAPSLLRQINLLGPRVTATTFATTRALYCTGTDLHASEVRAFHKRYRVPVINYYGLTESVGLCIAQRLSDWSVTDSSLGWPAGCELRVLDGDGNVVPRGTRGELQVRQPLPMSGYLDDPEATDRCFDQGWLRTGDIVCQQEDGRICLVGRQSGFIKTQNTERVHPREIEAVLEQHECVAEAAVCGLPQPTGGESIAAVLVARPGWTPNSSDQKAIALFVTERLGRERAPVTLRWVPSIPRNTSGKILRNSLTGLFDA